MHTAFSNIDKISFANIKRNIVELNEMESGKKRQTKMLIIEIYMRPPKYIHKKNKITSQNNMKPIKAPAPVQNLTSHCMQIEISIYNN